MENAILTIKQVAQELSLREETVRALMRKKELPATKIGGSWRTTRRALYEYLENRMGLSCGVHAPGGKDSGQGLFQVQGRGQAMDKRTKGKVETPEEVFFPK